MIRDSQISAWQYSQAILEFLQYINCTMSYVCHAQSSKQTLENQEFISGYSNFYKIEKIVFIVVCDLNHVLVSGTKTKVQFWCWS